jgi:hypothetical protein
MFCWVLELVAGTNAIVKSDVSGKEEMESDDGLGSTLIMVGEAVGIG